MKNIYKILSLMLAAGTFAACSEKEPFATATADDYPRIIDPIFPDRSDGELPVISNIGRDAGFSMELTVTPADHCLIKWFLDGAEVAEGKSIEIDLMAGTYDFKVTVSTDAGYSTSREGYIQVNPLASDPWADEISFERIITPGSEARLYGDNLDKVSRIVIGTTTISNPEYTLSEDGDYLSYTVPEGIADGIYRMILVDADGNEYGGDRVTVTSDALILSGADRTGAGREWVLTGINLDRIASMTIDDETVTEFTRQSAGEIAFICPELADGEYSLTGKTVDGNEVLFYSADGNRTEQTAVVSSQIILWSGHHYVSWDLADSDPNKTFNLIGKETFATLKAGSVLGIHYSLEPTAEYHQIRTTTVWWNDLPGTAQTDLFEDGVFNVTLTQESLDKIQEEDGFICVGHGYYVDMVTVE